MEVNGQEMGSTVHDMIIWLQLLKALQEAKKGDKAQNPIINSSF